MTRDQIRRLPPALRFEPLARPEPAAAPARAAAVSPVVIGLGLTGAWVTLMSLTLLLVG